MPGTGWAAAGGALAMILTTEAVDIPAEGGSIRALLARPKAAGRFPGLLVYSDIFQITGPMERATARLAGHGFVVAAPEIYRRIEPPGTAIPFDDAGRARGLADAAATPVAHFDADARSVLDYLKSRPEVGDRPLGVAGFCIGGHLAFRAALQPDVKAGVCYYPTGIQNGKLGADPDAGSLARAGEIRGELLLVFGTADPHIPPDGREAIVRALHAAGVAFQLRTYPSEHAFMRDEGPRYDPEATDDAFAAGVAHLRRNLRP